jgi:SNF2 family DNA or RNA helicase
MDQAADRVHRIGQRESVTIWSLAAPASVDDTLYQALADKRVITGQVLDGQARVITEENVKARAIRDLVLRVKERKQRGKAA